MSTSEPVARPTEPINVRWRKKPVVIEAVRVTAADFNGYNFDSSPFTAVPLWLQEAINSGVVHVTPDDRDYAVWGLRTLEGTMLAMPGDWIIRGVKGELYPCKNDIFEATYEPA